MKQVKQTNHAAVGEQSKISKAHKMDETCKNKQITLNHKNNKNDKNI
jgi:hypothetical protein